MSHIAFYIKYTLSVTIVKLGTLMYKIKSDI